MALEALEAARRVQRLLREAVQATDEVVAALTTAASLPAPRPPSPHEPPKKKTRTDGVAGEADEDDIEIHVRMFSLGKTLTLDVEAEDRIFRPTLTQAFFLA